jgi:hypothetical protein
MLPNSNGTNENRAKFRRDSVNPMTPRSADGPIATGRIDPNCVAAPEQPPGILRSGVPMTLDPHKNLRNSAFNLSVKPAEKSRAAESAETRRRLNPASGDTYR